MDWGDIPTWGGVVFAALAAAATIWTLKSQRDQIDEQRTFIGEQRALIAEQSTNLALERTELRAAAYERKVAQALQVRMKVKAVILNGDEQGEPIPNALRVDVTNGSAMPIHEVTVLFRHFPAAAATETELSEVGIRARRVAVGPRLDVPVPLIGAGKVYRFISDPVANSVETDRPFLVFRDNGHVKWRLDEHGDLCEVDPPLE